MSSLVDAAFRQAVAIALVSPEQNLGRRLTRADVAAAVDQYGLAWTTQDPNRIAQLFSETAVYVERAFDKNATFRGRDAIRAYWETQICGKQSNIRFRHVESEMVLDAEVRRQHPSDDD